MVQHLIVFWHLQIGYSPSISPILLINPSQIITHKYNSSILIQPFFNCFLDLHQLMRSPRKQLSVFYDFTTQCVTTNNLFVFVLCISWFLFNFILFNCAPLFYMVSVRFSLSLCFVCIVSKYKPIFGVTQSILTVLYLLIFIC